MCIVLNRSYRICQKTKKEDIPFQHGKGRFQPTGREGTKQFPEAKSESCNYVLRAGGNSLCREALSIPLEGSGQTGGPCWPLTEKAYCSQNSQLEAHPTAPLLRKVLPAEEKAEQVGPHSEVPEEDPMQVLTRASQCQR